MEEIATTALKLILSGIGILTAFALAESKNLRHFRLYFIGYFIYEQGVRTWCWGDYWAERDPDRWLNERGLATNATIILLLIVFWLGAGLGALAIKFLWA